MSPAFNIASARIPKPHIHRHKARNPNCDADISGRRAFALFPNPRQTSVSAADAFEFSRNDRKSPFGAGV